MSGMPKKPPIPSRCPHCRRRLTVPERMRERVLTCPSPSCGRQFRLEVASVPVAGSPPHPVHAPPPPPDFGYVPSPPVWNPPPAWYPPPPPRPQSEVETFVPDFLDEPHVPSRSAPEPPPRPPARRPDPRDEEPPRGRRSGLPLALAASALLVLVGGAGVGGYFLFRGKPDPPPEKYGGIEIGSKGVKAAVANFRKTGDGYDFDLVYSDTKNAGLANLAADGDFDPKALDDVTKHVEAYYRAMTAEHGLSADRIHILVSSGPFAGIKDAGRKGKNRGLLADRIKQAVGKDVDAITDDREAQYEFQACVRTADRADTLLIDIGGGNTKGGYPADNGAFVKMGVPFGTTTFAKKVAEDAKATGRPQPDVAGRLRKPLLEEPLGKQTDDNPVLARKPRVYLMGGLVWGMATYTHPGDVSQLRSALAADDIAKFRAMLAKPDPEKARKEAVAGIPQADPAGQELAKKADAEFGRLFDVYKPPQMLAATEILLALSKEYDFPNKELVFFRQGQNALVIGYLADKTGFEKAAGK